MYLSRGSLEFTAYVNELRMVAEGSKKDLLETGMAEQEYNARISDIARNVFEFEIKFWNMAEEG